MKQGADSQEASLVQRVHRPKASLLQADPLLASSSSTSSTSSVAARPASNGSWTAVCTITGAPLEQLLYLCRMLMQCRCVLHGTSAQGRNEAFFHIGTVSQLLLPLKHAVGDELEGK